MTTTNSIDARVSQLTTFLTYGLSESLDVSVALPLVSTDLTVVSDTVVRRIGTTNPETHFFNTSSDEVGDRRIFTAFGSASGIVVDGNPAYNLRFLYSFGALRLDLPVRWRGSPEKPHGLGVGDDFWRLPRPPGDESEGEPIGVEVEKPLVPFGTQVANEEGASFLDSRQVALP